METDHTDRSSRRIHLTVREGVNLRELDQDDVPAYFHLVQSNRAHLSRWLQWVAYVNTTDDCAVAIREFQGLKEACESLTLGIWADESLAGVVCLQGVDRTNDRAALAYWLGVDFLGRGMMAASCAALLEHAFATLHLHRIELSAAVENVASWRLAERLGFRLEGTQRESERLHGEYLDHRLYGLLVYEWESMKGTSLT